MYGDCALREIFTRIISQRAELAAARTLVGARSMLDTHPCRASTISLELSATCQPLLALVLDLHTISV